MHIVTADTAADTAVVEESEDEAEEDEDPHLENEEGYDEESDELFDDTILEDAGLFWDDVTSAYIMREDEDEV